MKAARSPKKSVDINRPRGPISVGTVTYRISFFLLDRQSPGQLSASVASYPASRDDATVFGGSKVNERSDSNLHIVSNNSLEGQAGA